MELALAKMQGAEAVDAAPPVGGAGVGGGGTGSAGSVGASADAASVRESSESPGGSGHASPAVAVPVPAPPRTTRAGGAAALQPPSRSAAPRPAAPAGGAGRSGRFQRSRDQAVALAAPPAVASSRASSTASSSRSASVVASSAGRGAAAAAGGAPTKASAPKQPAPKAGAGSGLSARPAGEVAPRGGPPSAEAPLRAPALSASNATPVKAAAAASSPGVDASSPGASPSWRLSEGAHSAAAPPASKSRAANSNAQHQRAAALATEDTYDWPEPTAAELAIIGAPKGRMEPHGTGAYVYTFPDEGYFACRRCHKKIASASKKCRAEGGYASFSAYCTQNLRCDIVVNPRLEATTVTAACTHCLANIGMLHPLQGHLMVNSASVVLCTLRGGAELAKADDVFSDAMEDAEEDGGDGAAGVGGGAGSDGMSRAGGISMRDADATSVWM